MEILSHASSSLASGARRVQSTLIFSKTRLTADMHGSNQLTKRPPFDFAAVAQSKDAKDPQQTVIIQMKGAETKRLFLMRNHASLMTKREGKP